MLNDKSESDLYKFESDQKNNKKQNLNEISNLFEKPKKPKKQKKCLTKKIKNIIDNQLQELNFNLNHFHKLLRDNGIKIDKSDYKSFNKLFKREYKNYINNIIYKSPYPITKYKNQNFQEKYQYHIGRIKILILDYKNFCDFDNFIIYTDKILDLKSIIQEVRNIIDNVYFVKSSKEYKVLSIDNIEFYNIIHIDKPVKIIDKFEKKYDKIKSDFIGLTKFIPESEKQIISGISKYEQKKESQYKLYRKK